MTAPKGTRTIYHPRLGTSREVPTASVDGWKAAGWRTSAPKAAEDRTEPEQPWEPTPTTPDDDGTGPGDAA